MTFAGGAGVYVILPPICSASAIFSYAQGDESFAEIQKVDSKFLSSETVGGFTGLYVGFYTTGNGKSCESDADCGWFELVGDSK